MSLELAARGSRELLTVGEKPFSLGGGRGAESGDSNYSGLSGGYSNRVGESFSVDFSALELIFRTETLQ